MKICFLELVTLIKIWQSNLTRTSMLFLVICRIDEICRIVDPAVVRVAPELCLCARHLTVYRNCRCLRKQVRRCLVWSIQWSSTRTITVVSQVLNRTTTRPIGQLTLLPDLQACLLVSLTTLDPFRIFFHSCWDYWYGFYSEQILCLLKLCLEDDVYVDDIEMCWSVCGTEDKDIGMLWRGHAEKGAVLWWRRVCLQGIKCREVVAVVADLLVFVAVV